MPEAASRKLCAEYSLNYDEYFPSIQELALNQTTAVENAIDDEPEGSI